MENLKPIALTAAMVTLTATGAIDAMTGASEQIERPAQQQTVDDDGGGTAVSRPGRRPPNAGAS